MDDGVDDDDDDDDNYDEEEEEEVEVLVMLSSTDLTEWQPHTSVSRLDVFALVYR